MKKINWMDWWNAAEYIFATIHNPNCYIKGTEPEWFEIHSGRAHCSRGFLEKIKNFAVEMNRENAVVLSQKEYEKLLDSKKKLECLEAGGVDNWEWYSESLEQGGYFDEDES